MSDTNRERIKALRQIPELQRTDAQWDELNLLEIEMAVRVDNLSAPVMPTRQSPQPKKWQGNMPTNRKQPRRETHAKNGKPFQHKYYKGPAKKVD